MSEILDLSPETFDETVNRDGIVLIDAWAGWCGPCRMFAPVFAKAARVHKQHTFAKIDTEIHSEFVRALHIDHIPTLMIYRDGILLYHKAGSPSEGSLENLIRQVEDLDMEQVRRDLAAQESQSP